MTVVTKEHWGIENVRLADAPDPVPAAGEVLSIPAPYTPGWDLAGVA